MTVVHRPGWWWRLNCNLVSLKFCLLRIAERAALLIGEWICEQKAETRSKVSDIETQMISSSSRAAGRLDFIDMQPLTWLRPKAQLILALNSSPEKQGTKYIQPQPHVKTNLLSGGFGNLSPTNQEPHANAAGFLAG
jgi:hypothetical protein